jgi:cytochrome P450
VKFRRAPKRAGPTVDTVETKAQLERWAVPAPPVGSVQAHMARFSEGDEHERRRAIAEARLAVLDPGKLRAAAYERTAALLAGRDEVEVIGELTRTVPVAVLAAALGATDADAAVATTRRLCLALALPEGSEPADGWPEVRALAFLLGLDGDANGEEAVNVVALLFQAMDATAGLIGNALRAGAAPPPVTVVRTLRVTPAGERRAVDLAAADPPLPFGAGRHRCPGEAHALALAAGVLDALNVAGAVVVDAPETDEPRPNLRIPTRLVVRLPR